MKAFPGIAIIVSIYVSLTRVVRSNYTLIASTWILGLHKLGPDNIKSQVGNAFMLCLQSRKTMYLFSWQMFVLCMAHAHDFYNTIVLNHSC